MHDAGQCRDVSTREYQHALARLHLMAVLPTMSRLVFRDVESARLIANANFALRLTTRSGLSAQLGFRHGAVVVDEGGSESKPLVLYFFSDRLLNNLFTGQGLILPIPIGGFRHLGALGFFSRIGRRLQRVLNGTPQALRRDGLLELHVDLLWGQLIPSAIEQLAFCDSLCRAWLEPFQGATAQIVVDGAVSSWIHCTGDGAQSGTGESLRAPDVIVRFSSREVALDAIHGRLDHLAAIGSGRMSVRGLIPFADTLDRVLKRVGSFLQA